MNSQQTASRSSSGNSSILRSSTTMASCLTKGAAFLNTKSISQRDWIVKKMTQFFDRIYLTFVSTIKMHIEIKTTGKITMKSASIFLIFWISMTCQAQHIYKCGNSYQQNPCTNGAQPINLKTNKPSPDATKGNFKFPTTSDIATLNMPMPDATKLSERQIEAIASKLSKEDANYFFEYAIGKEVLKSGPGQAAAQIAGNPNAHEKLRAKTIGEAIDYTKKLEAESRKYEATSSQEK